MFNKGDTVFVQIDTGQIVKCIIFARDIRRSIYVYALVPLEAVPNDYLYTSSYLTTFKNGSTWWPENYLNLISQDNNDRGGLRYL